MIPKGHFAYAMVHDSEFPFHKSYKMKEYLESVFADPRAMDMLDDLWLEYTRKKQ